MNVKEIAKAMKKQLLDEIDHVYAATAEMDVEFEKTKTLSGKAKKVKAFLDKNPFGCNNNSAVKLCTLLLGEDVAIDPTYRVLVGAFMYATGMKKTYFIPADGLDLHGMLLPNNKGRDLVRTPKNVRCATKAETKKFINACSPSMLALIMEVKFD